MSDGDLRALERRWRETGSEGDWFSWARALARAGNPAPLRLWMLVERGAVRYRRRDRLITTRIQGSDPRWMTPRWLLAEEILSTGIRHDLLEAIRLLRALRRSYPPDPLPPGSLPAFRLRETRDSADRRDARVKLQRRSPLRSPSEPFGIPTCHACGADLPFVRTEPPHPLARYFCSSCNTACQYGHGLESPYRRPAAETCLCRPSCPCRRAGASCGDPVSDLVPGQADGGPNP